MLKIKIDGERLTFAEGGIIFDAVINNSRLVELTDIRDGDLKKPSDKYVTNASAAGSAALATFEAAAMADTRVKNWRIDDLPVVVCNSAAGYYAGCMTYTGEHYTRISEYAPTPAFVLHWIVKHAPATLGEVANAASKVVEVEQEKQEADDTVAALRKRIAALEDTLDKARAYYKDMRMAFRQQQALAAELAAANKVLEARLNKAIDWYKSNKG